MMTPELYVLVLAALLQVGQFTIYSVTAQMQVGPKVAMGPRDTVPPLTGIAGRAQRAMTNHFEGLILFSIAVGVIAISGQSTTFTTACAWVYLIARIVYVPCYLFGFTPWRSYVWSVGLLATLALLIAALI